MIRWCTAMKLIKDVIYINAQNKDEFIRKLSKKVAESELVEDDKVLVSELLKRESVGSTLIEEGVAMPHVESFNVKVSSVVVVKTDSIVWQDGENNVDLVIVLLLKQNEDSKIKKQIQMVVRKFADDEFVNKIRQIRVEEIQNILNRI